MIVPLELREQAENFDEVYGLLTREYQRNWHKNSGVARYQTLRRLWGAAITIDHSRDVCSTVNWEGGDELFAKPGTSLAAWSLPEVSVTMDDQVHIAGGTAGTLATATTLRGILRQQLRSRVGDSLALAEAFFCHIARANNEVGEKATRNQHVFLQRPLSPPDAFFTSSVNCVNAILTRTGIFLVHPWPAPLSRDHKWGRGK